MVSHDEILRYQPLNTQHGDLIFKHHLLHHFLQEKVVHKQKRKNHVAIRGTPTLSYWQKKFSNSILSIYENEIAIDENFLKVAHIPYHLFSRHEGKALIAHLARFTLDSGMFSKAVKVIFHLKIFRSQNIRAINLNFSPDKFLVIWSMTN